MVTTRPRIKEVLQYIPELTVYQNSSWSSFNTKRQGGKRGVCDD